MPNSSSGSDREAQTGKTGEGKSRVTVTLQNVRGIKKLEFTVPKPGLWLVTGINGCEKSTLFAALYRLKYSQAFRNLYRSDKHGIHIDNFNNAKITYEIKNEKVTYSLSKTNWSPTPRNKALKEGNEIYTSIPYEETILIDADKKRIQPTEDEIKNSSSIKKSDEELKNFMKDIFNDDKDKWERLYKINKPNKGIKAYLISNDNNKSQYFSEKSFSLGELCLLRLGEQVTQSEQGSLILIEEIDMALHSKIQLKLYDKLKKIAEEKKHTILFSSHSSSLIKRAFREERKDQKVIFLQRESEPSNNIRVITDKLSPAKVLKDMTDDKDEILIDFIYFVEDKEARYLLKSLIEKYNELNESNIIDHFIILPYGGWPDIFNRLNRHEKFREIIQEHIQVYIFLDKDVGEKSSKKDKEKIKNLQARILPITPEKGLVSFLSENNAPTLQKYNLPYSEKIKSIIKQEEYKKINDDKKRFCYIVRKITDKGNREDDIKSKLYESYANHYAENNPSELCELLRPQKS